MSMQRSPDGRHTAVRPRRSRMRARAKRRSTAARLSWIVVLGVVSALVGVGLTIGLTKRQAVLSASNTTTAPLLGSSVLSESDLAQDTSQFGHMPVVRVYYPGLPSANAWTTGLAAANKSAVIVSFKALPTTILSGADDAALTHFFDTAPSGRPIYYSYYHEPEDNIAAGQFTLADYKAAWARVVKLADAAHNPYLHSTLILMEWDLQKASGRDWKSYLPGGGIISTLGWDAYPQGSATNQNPQPTPPADFMGPAIAASNSVGLPYGFAEFGLSTATGRGAWMKEVGSYLMNSGALFATYFDGNTQYPTLRLTDSASIGIWRGFVAKSGTNTLEGPISTPKPAPTATASKSPSPAPAPSPSSSPTPSASPAPAPAGSGPVVSGLSASPAALTPGGSAHTAISFRLAQGADVTVCILNSEGTVVRQLTRPGRAAGQVTVPYYGYNGSGQHLAAGRYPVLVVASNGNGSATAETALTITAP
jgi:hypothetical protein